MATKNWNNDFMAKVLEEDVWKELSRKISGLYSGIHSTVFTPVGQVG